MNESSRADALKTRFWINDVVTHLTSPGSKGIIVQVSFYPGGIYYDVQWAPGQRSTHYEAELLPVLDKSIGFTEP